MIAQSPIPVFLDTVRVPWFNTANNQEKEAIIPARRINIGLPKRAELLADLALQDDWKTTLMFKMRSTGQLFYSWHLSLTVLCFIAIGLGFSELMRVRQNRARRAKGEISGVLPGL